MATTQSIVFSQLCKMGNVPETMVFTSPRLLPNCVSFSPFFSSFWTRGEISCSTSGSHISVVANHGTSTFSRLKDGPIPPTVFTSLFGSQELQRIASMADTTGDEVRELIMSGADPQFRFQGGVPVLHVVAGSGNVEVASALVEAGADIDAQDDLGWTAVHIASAVGRVDLVEFFVAAGADVTLRSMYDRSPLDDVCSLVANCPDGAVASILSLLSRE